MSMMNKKPNLSMQSQSFAWDEFVELTGLTPSQLEELVDLGWFDTGMNSTRVFRDDDLWRVRKLERICGFFGLSAVGGTIIVDLLERIDNLERTVRALNNFED